MADLSPDEVKSLGRAVGLDANVPALCVPCGFAAVDGRDLPIGLQLAGKPFDDGLLLKVAHAYEQSTAWHTRRPPIA